MSDALRIRALCGEPRPSSDRGLALWYCRHLRALRSWITPGCYAWWRLSDDLHGAQRKLITMRRNRDLPAGNSAPASVTPQTEPLIPDEGLYGP